VRTVEKPVRLLDGGKAAKVLMQPKGKGEGYRLHLQHRQPDRIAGRESRLRAALLATSGGLDRPCRAVGLSDRSHPHGSYGSNNRRDRTPR
jgi:hypothetical protein